MSVSWLKWTDARAMIMENKLTATVLNLKFKRIPQNSISWWIFNRKMWSCGRPVGILLSKCTAFCTFQNNEWINGLLKCSAGEFHMKQRTFQRIDSATSEFVVDVYEAPLAAVAFEWLGTQASNTKTQNVPLAWPIKKKCMGGSCGRQSVFQRKSISLS